MAKKKTKSNKEKNNTKTLTKLDMDLWEVGMKNFSTKIS